ncbi:hypothetical protein [Sulfuracidifex metallicus]|uniref:Uncharacterized protein n=1 Tax=Sulfuracidifex metallicus DSM 6482 = JCM 9184 TaxID=523847 RepID=A0A6A9QLX5_SULME|nr:hypothetical protein [Sulfuracidifex metallicus]MUN28255.1 hypothetical protein [Sulfuracidifex metallicus DSM 6482 = JCM 9184]WOE51215.1 hypothetical protein RQ359_000477 [Sulfuracidifex metallicus DSM 6482 = JCM 9184]
MNKELERKIAYWRCRNKSAIFIAKTLNISCEDVWRTVKDWKIKTQNYLSSINNDQESVIVPDITGLLKRSDLTREYAERLLSDKNVINYITLSKNDNHNRYMDCIRYHILLLKG